MENRRRLCYYGHGIYTDNPIHDEVVNCKDRILGDAGSFGRVEYFCANTGKNGLGGGVCPPWEELDAQKDSLKKK